MNDSVYMHRCIELARLAAGLVAPNPMVGAVLVCDGRIIGEGYHRHYGQAHAEVNCLADAAARHASAGAVGPSLEERFRKSTLYVSLEPCAHFGKTPPCADLIISKKIPKVVIGCRDPFEQVDGKGIAKLGMAGIEVVTGMLEESCLELNKRFFTFHRKQRPYIILKWAQTADHFIAAQDAERILISNAISNRRVHQWRSEEASILVGTHTALKDDPLLTTRLWSGHNPVRLVIDMHARLPASLRVFNEEARTLVFTHGRQGKVNNGEYYPLGEALTLSARICSALYDLNIQSVLVEGGANTIQTFIDDNCWDEARVITNNELRIGQGLPAPRLHGATETDSEVLYSDTIRVFRH